MLYDYKCTKCRIEFDEFVCLDEMDAPQECPVCASQAFRIKRMYVPNTKVKGGRTDLYPMVNPHVGEKVVHTDRAGNIIKIERKPVRWESGDHRAKWLKERGMCDAHTPYAETQTMYSDDSDWEAYQRSDAKDRQVDAMISERKPGTCITPRFVEVNENEEIVSVD